jgi:ribose transport system permease protein
MSDRQPQWYQSRGLVPRAGWAPLLRRYGIVFALVVLVGAVAIGSPSFLTVQNLLNIVVQWTPVGIMAVGATYVILAGGFDLSAASGFALCTVVAAILATSGVPVWLSFTVAVLVGVGIGVANAILIVVLKINPFIATLASGFVLAGAPFILVENPFIMVSEDGFDTLGTGFFLGIPYSGYVLLAFFLVGGVVLSRTAYGQWIYSIGGNPEASHLFGIRVNLVTASTYLVSGLSMGVAAIVSASQLSYSASEQDPALIFDVIVAVVVGGTSLAGGYGAVWRTAVGLATLAALQNGLNLLQVNSFSQYIVKGLIIIAALGFDVWMRSLAASSERSARLRPVGAGASAATTGGGT